MAKRLTGVLRRTVLKRFAAGAAVAAIARPAFAVPETIKIGLVAPQTGPLALFNEEMAYALDHARKALNNSIKINGTVHPLEFVVKDSQSNPNRAAEVTQDLILRDKVHLVTAFATPETVNPVADQCELNGMPCVTNDDPLESYFFGRHGDLKVSDRSAACRNHGRNPRDSHPLGWPSVAPDGGRFGRYRDHCAG
jgi:branched-chain amino acid transport system substrate-binding protein